jgi:hypothetical protein
MCIAFKWVFALNGMGTLFGGKNLWTTIEVCMTVLGVIGVISVAGAVGGAINALLTDNAFIMPYRDKDNRNIIRPGMVGNIFIGIVAALVSWGLYGPWANTVWFVGKLITNGTLTPMAEVNIGVTISTLAGAVLVGIGGSRWLTSEVDKRLFNVAITNAANRPPDDPKLKGQFIGASPQEALDLLSR